MKIVSFFRTLNKQAAWEAARTTFGIMGAMGYAGYLAAMHWLLAIVSLTLTGAAWYGVYRMTEGA